METDTTKGNMSGNDETTLVLILMFLPIVGRLAYYFVDRKQRLSEPDVQRTSGETADIFREIKPLE